MKKVFLVAGLLVSAACHSQCEPPPNSGSFNLHYLKGNKSAGIGGEFGMQGLASNSSFFLGADWIVVQRGSKGLVDTGYVNLYAKYTHRLYQVDRLHLEAVGGLGLMGADTDVDGLVGIRVLHTFGYNAAFSLEPLYYVRTKAPQINASIHFVF